MNLRIGDHFYVQPGAHYMRWGHELEGPKDVINDPGDVIDNVNFSGFHIPVLVGYKILITLYTLYKKYTLGA